MDLTNDSLARFTGGRLELTIAGEGDQPPRRMRAGIATARMDCCAPYFELQGAEEILGTPSPTATWIASADWPFMKFCMVWRAIVEDPTLPGQFSIDHDVQRCTIYAPGVGPLWGSPELATAP
jgi:hypothetical protein